MKKMPFIIPLVVLIIGLAFTLFQSPRTALGAVGTIIKATVSTGVTVGTSSVEVLAANSSRQYAVFVNDSANVIYISLDGNAAVAGKGIRLNASGGSYEINSLNQFVASVHAIAAGAGSNLTVTASQ